MDVDLDDCLLLLVFVDDDDDSDENRFASKKTKTNEEDFRDICAAIIAIHDQRMMETHSVGDMDIFSNVTKDNLRPKYHGDKLIAVAKKADQELKDTILHAKLFKYVDDCGDNEESHSVIEEIRCWR